MKGFFFFESVGVPGGSLELGKGNSGWVPSLGEISRNFCVGVRDLGSYPKFLCGCKRPVELSEISVWV